MPGTSKPMPKKAGGTGDAEDSGDATDGTDASAAARSGSAATGSPPPFQEAPSVASAAPATSHAAAESTPRAPVFAAPRPLSEVSFDDAKPSAATFPGRPAPGFPAASPDRNAPSYTPPRPLSDTGFDDLLPPESPRQAPPAAPGFPGAAGAQPPAPAAGPVPGPAIGGMGISISGVGLPAAPKQTPAQLSAANQSVRIRLLRPDGKPFDGPEITTGPKPSDAQQNPARTEFDRARNKVQKQAPKVVVKAGPLERVGHILAVLAISAIGIVPLGYLLLQSVHDREDKLAARISVPTKMNVLDGTSEGYLGGMAVVLLIVAVLYWSRLRRRRTR